MAHSGDRGHVIVAMVGPMPWRSLALGAVGGLSAIWLGVTGNTGLLQPYGVSGQRISVALGSVGLIFIAGVAANRVVQGRDVLVGDADGLLLIRPFGLHRIMKRARLSGDLKGARLTSAIRPGRGRLQSEAYQIFTVTAGDRSIKFPLGVGLANEDYEDRFRDWLAWYQSRRAVD